MVCWIAGGVELVAMVWVMGFVDLVFVVYLDYLFGVVDV
jgi:hypothetical protein